MPFVEDMSPFFADFGATGTLAGRQVVGIFDDGAGMGEFGGMRIQRGEPSFTLPASAILPGDDSATLVIPQGTFSVRRIEPGDPGMVALLLENPA